MEQIRVSIIIPTYNEGAYLIETVKCLFKNTGFLDYEVIVVDDGSTDGSCDLIDASDKNYDRISVVRTTGLGVAGARNYGARYAKGNIVIFLDAHSYTPPGWMAELISPFTDPQVGMVGPAFSSLNGDTGARGLGAAFRDASLQMTWLPQKGDDFYSVPLLPGGCQAFRKIDFENIGGYDTGMTRWGSEDLEISLRSWLMGYRVVVQPSVVIYHLFRNNFPYHVEAQGIYYNRLRMALLHFSGERITRVFDHYKKTSGFGKLIFSLFESDTKERRQQLLRQRCRDDDWFFSEFGCSV